MTRLEQVVVGVLVLIVLWAALHPEILDQCNQFHP